VTSTRRGKSGYCVLRKGRVEICKHINSYILLAVLRRHFILRYTTHKMFLFEEIFNLGSIFVSNGHFEGRT
jgi:hypothetical protein